MGGQIKPLQELAYNIHFFNIQVIFDFADIFVSHENKSKSSFESIRNEKIRGQMEQISAGCHALSSIFIPLIKSLPILNRL